MRVSEGLKRQFLLALLLYDFLSVFVSSLKYSSEETQKTSCSAPLHLSNFNFSPNLQVSLLSIWELQWLSETARSTKPHTNYATIK